MYSIYSIHINFMNIMLFLKKDIVYYEEYFLEKLGQQMNIIVFYKF